ncbi:MAG: DUF4266 domain-containing protein [Gallionella sp.]
MNRSKLGLYIMLMCWVVGLEGCKNVEPWERGNLARPEMQLEAHPAQRALREHVYGSREAGASGTSAAGGGCGCY